MANAMQQIHGHQLKVADVYFDLSPADLDEALALVDEVPEEKLRRAYAVITGDPIPRALEAVLDGVREAVRIEHFKAHNQTEKQMSEQTTEKPKRARKQKAEQAEDQAPAARVRIDDVIAEQVAAGNNDVESVLKAVDGFIAEREPSDLSIKDITIREILAGSDFETTVAKLHEVFDGVEGKEVRSGKNEFAFYRSRLRTQHGVDLPRATRPKAEQAEGEEAPKPKRSRGKKKAAEAQEQQGEAAPE